MTSNTAEVIAFFVVAVSFIVAAAVFVVSVCYLIKWIRAYFNKESKPFRIRIAIAFVVVSLCSLSALNLSRRSPGRSISDFRFFYLQICVTIQI